MHKTINIDLWGGEVFNHDNAERLIDTQTGLILLHQFLTQPLKTEMEDSTAIFGN